MGTRVFSRRSMVEGLDKYFPKQGQLRTPELLKDMLGVRRFGHRPLSHGAQGMRQSAHLNSTAYGRKLYVTLHLRV